MKRSLLSLFAVGCAPLFGLYAPQSVPAVELVYESGQYTLLRNGKPYIIKGVGGTNDLDLLASYGANTIRTWDAEGIGPLLDHAQELGIAVVAGIWLEPQRNGFDYNDTEKRQQQLDRVERLVKEFRDHPALLAWGVGNEVELAGDFDLAVKQINSAAAIIKRLDPNHPRISVIAGAGEDKAARIQRACPDIDFLGINSYGELGNLTKRLETQGYTGAWAVTEYGVAGHWESEHTPWGAPQEQSSGAKADLLREGYEKTIRPNLGTRCLGSFAFYWGHKQEKTETWYGLLLPTGETTERVDVLSEMWTGRLPENRAPRVTTLSVGKIDVNSLKPGQRVRVWVDASDPDRDPITIEWRVLSESKATSIGGDPEDVLKPIDVQIDRKGRLVAMIKMPASAGAYRIYATVRDGHGHAGTVNLPVLVTD